MIENKELPSEYVSIRQAWLKAINRVAESLAYRFKNDGIGDDDRTGQQIVIESILALKSLLVDFGECPIKTEVEAWHEKHEHELEKSDSFKAHKIYRRWFEFMIETLNKYGVLFESQPHGYSNVIMQEIKGDEKNE